MLNQAYDPEEFRQSGHQIIDFLADELARSLNRDADQVLPWTDPQTAFTEVEQWLADSEQARTDGSFRIRELFEKVHSRCIRLHHPNYMGHQINPPLPVAALAGLMSDLLNNGMGVYEMGIAGTAIERFVVQQVARQFGFNSQSDGVLTSGGTLGNLTALLAARSVQAPDDVWQGGHQSPLAIFTSDQAHYCVDRAARIMGLGEEGVVLIPTDDQYRMRTDLLSEHWQQAQSAGRHVIAVVGSACSTATGSFDNLEAIGRFCQQHKVWFHVDGAHGAAAAFSSKYRSCVAGIELADSVTLDFHKLLMTPALATAVVYRNGAHGRQAFPQKAEYLWEENTNPSHQEVDCDLARRTFECTKTMTGFKFFSILAAHGNEVFDANVTRLFELASEFADLISGSADFELAIQPQSNIVCFRHLPNDPQESSEHAIAEFNRRHSQIADRTRRVLHCANQAERTAIHANDDRQSIHDHG